MFDERDLFRQREMEVTRRLYNLVFVVCTSRDWQQTVNARHEFC